MKRILIYLLSAVLLAAGLSGCTGGNEAGMETGTGGVTSESAFVEFTFCVNNSNTASGFSFDPAVDYLSQKSVVMGIAETLLVLDDETKEVLPHLAVDYMQKDDTTWVFTIRDGVEFSNGKKLDAQACKDALEYIFANNTRLGTLADVASMGAEGQTLTIHTNEVVAILPRLLTEVNAIIFDTEASEDYSQGVVGTGAYILESVDAEGNCELVRNEDYWQGMPVAERIHTKANLDDASQTLALQSGEIDWAGIQTSDLPLFENNPEYKVLSYNPGRVYFLYLNTGHTFTEDPAVREALTYAFDREAILSGVYGGRGQVTTAIFPNYSEYFDESVGQTEYNQEKAKEILAEAGYADSDGDGYLDKDGERIHLNITCYDNNGFPTLSEVLQSMLGEIGIESDIVVSDAITEDLGSGQYNIGVYAYNTLTLGDCYNFLEPVFRTGGTANFTGFADPDVDAMLDEMKVTSDPEKRAELAIEIRKKIYEADQHIFLLHIERYTVVKSGIENITPMFGSDNANNFILWQFDQK